MVDRSRYARVALSRTMIGPFMPDVALGALAAGQTGKAFRYIGGIQAPDGFVAMRAGAVIGLSGRLTAPLTGAGGAGVFVTVNGSRYSTQGLSFTVAAANRESRSTHPSNRFVYRAGDVVSLVYDSGAIGNTPSLSVTIEVVDS